VAFLSRQDWLKRLLFEVAAGWYARKLATGPEADLRREFADFLSPAPGVAALDVGCGPGHLARLLAARGCRVAAVDRSWRLLRFACRLAAAEGLAVEFRRGSAERLPFADGSFDLTLATTVIYFVRDAGAVLREMVRVTRPGGVVATLDPAAAMNVASVRACCARRGFDRTDSRKLLIWARAAESFNQRFTEPELRGLLEGAGLAQLHLERRMDGLVWFTKAVKPSATP